MLVCFFALFLLLLLLCLFLVIVLVLTLLSGVVLPISENETTLMYCICCIFNWIFQVWGLNFKLKHEVFKKISQIKIYAYINIPDIHDMNKRVHKKLFISSFAAVGDQLLALIFRGITFERDAWQVLLRLDHPIVWITLICPGIISESALLNYFAAQLLQDMERERSAFLCKHYHIQI